jgi:hypothetical protein
MNAGASVSLVTAVVAEDASAVALRFRFDPPPHALSATQASAPARTIKHRLIDRHAFG